MILRHALMLGALALLPAFQSPAHAAQTYTLTGDDVAIWDPAGEVRMEAATGNAVEVVVQVFGQQVGESVTHDVSSAHVSRCPRSSMRARCNWALVVPVVTPSSAAISSWR